MCVFVETDPVCASGVCEHVSEGVFSLQDQQHNAGGHHMEKKKTEKRPANENKSNQIKQKQKTHTLNRHTLPPSHRRDERKGPNGGEDAVFAPSATRRSYRYESARRCGGAAANDVVAGWK